MSFFKNFKKEKETDGIFEVVGSMNDKKLIKTDLSAFDDKERLEFKKAAKETFAWGIEDFTGFVKHGYGLSFVKNKEVCPRCHNQTKQYYSNFIYVTNIAPRVMYAPAGYFCSECPAVIVDEEMISNAVKGKFQYNGVLGITIRDMNNEDPMLFKTWNGNDSIVILDEFGGKPIGIVSKPDLKTDKFFIKKKKNKNKSKKKKKIAKKSRKRNRK